MPCIPQDVKKQSDLASVRYYTVNSAAASNQALAQPEETAGEHHHWLPRVFIICGLTGRCIIDSGEHPMQEIDLSNLGSIAISSKSIFESLGAPPSEETVINLSSGELLAYIPQDSHLGYCIYAPTGMSHDR